MSPLPRLACLFVIWPAASNANAFCLPMVHYVNVGPATGTGTGCNYVYADLQTAINNVACPNTVLSIAGGVTLANVALEINGKTNLTIVGLGAGTTCNSPPPACDPEVGCGGGGGGAPPVPNVTLQGTGAGSVFYIHGNSSVTLESLTLKTVAVPTSAAASTSPARGVDDSQLDDYPNPGSQAAASSSTPAATDLTLGAGRSSTKHWRRRRRPHVAARGCRTSAAHVTPTTMRTTYGGAYVVWRRADIGSPVTTARVTNYARTAVASPWMPHPTTTSRSASSAPIRVVPSVSTTMLPYRRRRRLHPDIREPYRRTSRIRLPHRQQHHRKALRSIRY
jgi:hypothetical protein